MTMQVWSEPDEPRSDKKFFTWLFVGMAVVMIVLYCGLTIRRDWRVYE